jgi:hypothetical protein
VLDVRGDEVLDTDGGNDTDRANHKVRECAGTLFCS